jgi:hypothetical protein
MSIAIDTSFRLMVDSFTSDAIFYTILKNRRSESPIQPFF